MKVRLDKSVFTNATDEMRQQELNFLLNIIVYKDRYKLMVSDAEVLDSDGFSTLTQIEKKIIEEGLIDSITGSLTSADCEVAENGNAEDDLKIFTPEEAIIYLLQPLSIILENCLNDAHFMKAVFRWFDPTGELTRRVDEGWIRFENAGGCSNVRNFLTARINVYGGRRKFLNSYVLLDGDRRYPSDAEPEKKYRKLKETLNAWGVGCHELEKRCMENYMPDEAMNAFATAETQAWITAYHTLTAEQKDCYNIAEGFAKDISKEQNREVKRKESLLRTKDLRLRRVSYVRGFLPNEEKTFYTSVSKGNFLHLEHGLPVRNFKVIFPEKYGDNTVTYRANMLSRTSHQKDPLELEHIVSGIRSMI